MSIRPIDPKARAIFMARKATNTHPTAPKEPADAPGGDLSASASGAAHDNALIMLPPEKRAHHKVDRTTDNWDENGDYIVGKGRPPSGSRWKPGQSGNPRGPKPKEKLDPAERLDRHILADFNVRQNGEDVTVNMGEFVISLLKSGAAKGTVKSQLALMEFFMAALRRRVAATEDAPEMQAWEQQLIDTMLERFDLPAAPVVRAERDRSGGSEAEA